MTAHSTDNNEPRYRHHIPVQLRFSDVDRFGHVNNAVYFSLYDLAKTDYLQSIAHVGVHDQSVVPVVANIHADFLRPVYFDDPLAIETKTIRLGNKSFTLRQRAYNTRTGEVFCVCETILVCFSLKENVPVPIPEDARASIAAYEGL